MKTIPIVALVLPLFAAGPAFAQGTEAQRAACYGDAFRLCASSIPNVGKIASCLRQNRSQLSPGCAGVLAAADGGGEKKAVAAAKPAPAPVPKVAASVRAAAPKVVVTQRVVEPAPAPRRTLRAAARTTVPVPVASRAPATRVIVKYVYVNRPAARPTVARRGSAQRSFAGMGGRRGGSQMAQAMYWMKTVRGMAGSMGGGNLAGLSSMGGSLGGMSMGSLMSMIPY